MSNKGSPTAKTNLDDWDTDPDYVRDIDEMGQRWGDNKRTVGSINMHELIDEVRRDHKIMREKLDHSSQRDYSEGFGGKFGIQHDRKDRSAHDYDHLEKLSKHTSQEISHKVISSSKTSSIIKSGTIGDTKRSLLEKSNQETNKRYESSNRSPPTINRFNQTREPFARADGISSSSPDFEKMSSTSRIIREEKSSKGVPSDCPTSLRSIQDKIDAFKKQFEDLQSEVINKSENSKVFKKSTTLDNQARHSSSGARSTSPPGSRPVHSTSTYRTEADVPKSNIKSLSQKFENMCREDSENFRKKTEAKRREFFDQMKSQYRETRKDFEGFDPIDMDQDPTDDLERKMREKLEGLTGSWASDRPRSSQSSSAPRSSPQSPHEGFSSRSGSTQRLRDGSESNLSSGSLGKPKVYTHRETTQEKIVSKIVKENDKIIENETKRSLEQSSSHHGSSEDEDEPKSIKMLDKELRTSPQQVYQHKVSLSPSTPEPDLKASGLMARTLYDYQAADSDELSFDVDDLITNIEKIDRGWHKGTITRNGVKQVGLFPANYVRLLNDNVSEY